MGNPPMPPLPPNRLRISESSRNETIEPVGTWTLADTVRTNGLGHAEFIFHTQTVWQGWEFEQSDDGYQWQSFARSVHTNNTRTAFVVVNTAAAIRTNRVYRIRRIY